MFVLKKWIFKAMELGLGLNTFFLLETKDPVFVNFKLSEAEADAVQKTLPPGVTLKKIPFTQGDAHAEYWLSYNLYEVSYPHARLRQIRKVRCEINTFVEDAKGRRGVYVFGGSPYVSRERRWTILGQICDFAERVVLFLYGCGRLTGLRYELTADKLHIEIEENRCFASLEMALEPGQADWKEHRLSDDYFRCNDLSFFNHARTFDRVFFNGDFALAKFKGVETNAVSRFRFRSDFFERPPDKIYFHRGGISYLVSALNL